MSSIVCTDQRSTECCALHIIYLTRDSAIATKRAHALPFNDIMHLLYACVECLLYAKLRIISYLLKQRPYTLAVTRSLLSVR